jgi:hypothetical protein
MTTGTETALARRMRIDIDTGSSPTVSWNQLIGVFDLKPNIAAALQDDDTYDDEGGSRKAATGHDWSYEVKIRYRTNAAGTAVDDVHRFLRTKFNASTIDSDISTGEFPIRVYDRGGLDDGESYQGTAFISAWTPDSTGNRDLQNITLTFQGQGALTEITNPNADMDPVVTSVSDATLLAAGGELETIYGYHFTGATSVKFGATNAADFEVLSDTVIAAVTPAHVAGTVNVTVVTPEGTSATGADNQVVYA